MYRKSALGAAALALLLGTPAHAHHPTGVGSSGGTGPINTISATTLEQGQGAASIFFELVKMHAFSDAQLGVSGHPHSLDAILAPSLGLAYGVTKDLTVSVRLPFVQRTDIREGHLHGNPPMPEVHDLGNASGIGDLTLLGQYRFFNNRSTRTEAALLLGVKAPTGKTNLVGDTGDRFETEFQAGSGAWEGLFGLALTQRSGSWSFDSNVLYVLATKGAQQTDLGDRLQYNVALSYRLTGGLVGGGAAMYVGALPEPMYHGGPHAKSVGKGHTHSETPEPRGPALDLVLELNGEWHDRQSIAGVKDPNSGGNTVYLSPGLRVSSGTMSAFVSVGLPVISRMNGMQVEPDWRVVTGVSVGF